MTTPNLSDAELAGQPASYWTGVAGDLPPSARSSVRPAHPLCSRRSWSRAAAIRQYGRGRAARMR